MVDSLIDIRLLNKQGLYWLYEALTLRGLENPGLVQSQILETLNL